MYHNPRRLRRPEERVGNLTNADLPPPAIVDEDSLLITQIRAREEGVIRQLYDRYRPSLMRVAMSCVRSPEEAEEVIQDTWLAVLSGIDRFEGRSSFKTWLFRILVNRARVRAKREARIVPFSALESSDDVGIASSGPEEAFRDREIMRHVERAVASLPGTQRLIITLRDIEGWSAEEVCETLQLTHGNQRVLLHRARMKVRELLVPYFRGDDGVREACTAAGV